MAASSPRAHAIAAAATSRRSACRRGGVNKLVVLGHDYPALVRARQRKDRGTDEDRRLHQRHRWRSEGHHGEAKTWHGLARAVRRGLQNIRIQAFLTATAVNLKRLAEAVLAAALATLVAIEDAIEMPVLRWLRSPAARAA